MLPSPSVKVVIGGPSDVGKTAFSQRFSTGQFRVPRSSTVGLGFVSRRVYLDGSWKRIDLWDSTTASFSFQKSLDLLFEGADSVLLLVDAAKESCQETFNEWLDRVKVYAPGVPFLVVCHKCDRPQPVSSTHFTEALRRKRIPFIHSSSLLNLGVDGAVALLITMLKHSRTSPSPFPAWPPCAQFVYRWYKTLNGFRISQPEHFAAGHCATFGELQALCCARIYGLVNDVEHLASLQLSGVCFQMLREMFTQWPPERQVRKLCLLVGGGTALTDELNCAASIAGTQRTNDGALLKGKRRSVSESDNKESGRLHKLLRRFSSVT